MNKRINPNLLNVLPLGFAPTLRFALVKYGAGIVQMSGSIAGNVHFRNRFGNCVRPRTKPVNPRSVRQERARTVMSYLAEYWHSEMDDAQRLAWEGYAANVAMTNRLGETIHLTGFNHFIRSSANMRVVGGGAVKTAPTIQSLPPKDWSLRCSAEDIALQRFTFTCNPTDWDGAEDPKKNIIIYQGLPQLASRTFYATPWRYMGTVSKAEGAAGTCTEAAVFPFADKQKVWFQARIITDSRRLSDLWPLDPKVIGNPGDDEAEGGGDEDTPPE